MRRALIIILVLAVLTALGLGIYFFFFADKGSGVVVTTPGDPFGSAGNYQGDPSSSDPSAPSGNGGDMPAVTQVAPNFIKITDGPVARGAIAFNIREQKLLQNPGATTTATTTVQDTEVRYVERNTGNVYSYRAKSMALTRLTNDTLPGIEEATWVSDGSLVYVRYLSPNFGDRIQTYAFPVGEGVGYFLESGLEQVVSIGSSTIATLLPSVSGSVATLAKADGSVIRTLFSSELSSLRIAPTGNTIVAYTKPSANTNGYGFSVNALTGTLELLAGPQKGLSLLPSPKGTMVLSGYRQGNALRLELVDTATQAVVALPIGTLPEKCVWTRDASALYCAVPRTLPQGLPDSWYQGAVSFSDRIWKINIESRVAALVLDPQELAQVEIDAVALTLDPENNTLTFTNKKDGSLWLYGL